MPSKVRLYLDHPLAPGQTVPLSQPQANYLFNVIQKLGQIKGYGQH